MREDAEGFVCFEGRAYGASAPAERLLARVPDLGGDTERAVAVLRERASEWEGEYVALVLLKRARRLWVFGDPLGRLPLYAVLDPDGLALSRDQRFLIELGGGREVDRLGIAQLLLFGLPIGRRTLARGVERVPGGEVICADPGGVRRFAGPPEPATLEIRERAGLPAARNAADLVERFTEACRLRAAACGAPLLSLSGGLDSRAVAAGLARAGRPFECFTFLDAAGVHLRELAVAEQVARTLGAPWQRVDAPAPGGRALLRMLEMKTGLNSLAMAYSVAVFEALRATRDPGVSLWSGDGGDKVMPDHRPGLGRREAASYLVEHRPVFPVGMVAALTGVPEAEIRASVAETIAAYPERDPDQQFVRFILAERGARWVFEGEDCNRHYFWTVAPFFDRGFRTLALGCPDHQKSGQRLYRRFLHGLHPAMTAMPDVNLGLPVEHPAYAWSRRLREVGRRFPRLRRWLRLGVPSSVLRPEASLVSAILRRQIERSEPVSACFAAGALAAVAEAPERWGYAALDALLTATSAAERIMGRPATLEEFAGERFG